MSSGVDPVKRGPTICTPPLTVGVPQPAELRKRQTRPGFAASTKVRAGQAPPARKAKVRPSIPRYRPGKQPKGVNKEKDSLTKKLSSIIFDFRSAQRLEVLLLTVAVSFKDFRCFLVFPEHLGFLFLIFRRRKSSNLLF